MTRPGIAGIAAVALAAAAVLAGAGAASAHDVLAGSTPQAGETVTELPDSFSITMNEPLVGGTAAAFAMQVTDATGAFYGDGCLTLRDATMSMGATLGEPGEYHLVWQIVSSDGHPTAGEFDFTWSPSDPAQQSAGSAQPLACGAEPGTATPSDHHGGEPVPTEVPLESVLWIGGAVLVAGLVAAIAIVVTTRKRRET